MLLSAFEDGPDFKLRFMTSRTRSLHSPQSSQHIAKYIVCSPLPSGITSSALTPTPSFPGASTLSHLFTLSLWNPIRSATRIDATFIGSDRHCTRRMPNSSKHQDNNRPTALAVMCVRQYVGKVKSRPISVRRWSGEVSRSPMMPASEACGDSSDGYASEVLDLSRTANRTRVGSHRIRVSTQLRKAGSVGNGANGM